MKKLPFLDFRKTTAIVGLLLTLFAVAIGGKSVLLAAPPTKGEKPAHDQEKRPVIDFLTLVEGKVLEHSKNKPGDVDGFKLSAGPAIHFPPHLGVEVSQLIPLESSVRVFGKMKTRKDGSEVLEAVLIESNGRAFFIAPKEPKPKPSSSHADIKEEVQVMVTGKIEEFHVNKGGEVDGFRIADNAADVRFPPHVGLHVQQSAKLGDVAHVTARKHETPKGEIHLHAETIVVGGKTVTVEHHAKGDHPRPAPPKHGDEGPHHEIMRELREIRALIESLKK